MYIKISPIGWVHTRNTKMRDFLKKNSGKWLKVSTNHLFGNQYNVKGYRIYDSMINGIKGDKRRKTKKDAHDREWENQYFLTHSSKPKILKIDTEITHQGRKVPLCNVNDDYYRLSRRRSLEFIFDKNGKVYIANGIGFRSAEELRKVKVSSKINRAEFELLQKAVRKIKTLNK